MKLHPRNLVLLGIVLACYVLELCLRPEEAPAIDRTPVFDQLDPRAAARLRIEDGSGAPALVLQREGGSWQLASWFDFPAHDWVVEDLVSRLRGLHRGELVSADAGAAELFGFDGSERSIRIEGDEGRLLAELEVGSGPEGRGSHVRARGAPEVYRAPALALPEVDPKRFVRADLLEFDPAELRAIELELASEEVLVRLERVGDGRWKDTRGELFGASRVDGLVTWASYLYLQEVVAGAPEPSHGLEGRGWARLCLEFEDGERELLLGTPRLHEKGGLGERYATCKGWAQPWVVTVSPLTAERLVRLARALAR